MTGRVAPRGRSRQGVCHHGHPGSGVQGVGGERARKRPRELRESSRGVGSAGGPLDPVARFRARARLESLPPAPGRGIVAVSRAGRGAKRPGPEGRREPPPRERREAREHGGTRTGTRETAPWEPRAREREPSIGEPDGPALATLPDEGSGDRERPRRRGASYRIIGGTHRHQGERGARERRPRSGRPTRSRASRGPGRSSHSDLPREAPQERRASRRAHRATDSKRGAPRDDLGEHGTADLRRAARLLDRGRGAERHSRREGARP